MGKRITDQELEKIILDKCNEKGLIYSRYERNLTRVDYTKVYLICNNCKKEYTLIYSNLIKSQSSKDLCNDCDNLLFEDNFKKKCDEANITFLKFEDGIDNFCGNRNQRIATFSCKNGHIFSTMVQSIISGHSCPECGRNSCSKKLYLDKSIATNRVMDKCKKFDYEFIGWEDDSWFGTKSILNLKCLAKDHRFKLNYYQFMYHNRYQTCPECNISLMELELNKYFISLLKNNYERYWTTDWLIFNKHLSLDFYFPSFNLAIECQGEQHFFSKDYFGGEQRFKLQQKRDLLKYNLCKEHGITILYYTNVPKSKINFFAPVYTDINELLNEIKKYIN